MPYYDFRCASCGAVAEEFRELNDRDKAPVCQCKQPMKRIVSFRPSQDKEDAGIWKPYGKNPYRKVENDKSRDE